MIYDDVIIETAKAIWSCRPGSEFMPWDKLQPAGHQSLIADAKRVIATYKTALAQLEEMEQTELTKFKLSEQEWKAAQEKLAKFKQRRPLNPQ